ncbi:MAG: T9SS type A sorting domain-containing protein [Ignavibacterium sp.]|nr:T9SS type A sorting domain-containing protein [Ignavibacterium sp.]
MIIATTIYKTIFVILALSVLLLPTNTFGQDLEIYVSDAGNFASPPWKILKFDENGENPEIFIDTVLAWPQDIVFLEEQQVVLISNLNSGRITKYNSSTGDYIEDFATGIGGPTRMKIGADSLLYILQWNGNGKVKRYQLDGTFVDDFTTVGVPQSIGIDWDSNGNLYVSSYTGHTVRKFDQNGNDLGLFVNSNLLGPTNIWFDDNGDLLVSDYNGTAVKRFDSDGNYLSDFITGIHFSEGVDLFPNGNILIGNGSTSSVKLFDSSGNYIKDFITSGSGGLMTPNAVVIREIDPLSVPDESSIKNFEFNLNQNYPNPFNPTTTIGFSISAASNVYIEILNLLGQRVKTLENNFYSSGNYSLPWDGIDDAGIQVPSGIYFYQLKAGSFTQTKKMILLR